MKFSSYLVSMILIFLIGCTPIQQVSVPTTISTQPPLPTATETPSPTPAPTATVTPTATPQVPDIIMQMQADGAPGVEIMEGYKINIRLNDEDKEPEYLFRTPLPYEQIENKITLDSSAYVVRGTDGEKVAVYAPPSLITTERWGKGERWILQSEAIKSVTGFYEDNREYNPDEFVQVSGLDEYEEAKLLGYLFRPDHPGYVNWPTPKPGDTDYSTNYSNQDPIPFQPTAVGLPFKYYNNIMYDLGGGMFSSTLQEAVFCKDGRTEVLTFPSIVRFDIQWAADSSRGNFQEGNGSSYGNYLLPSYVLNMDVINNANYPMWNFLVHRENYSRLGLFTEPWGDDPSAAQDSGIYNAINNMLKTGNLQSEINGIPTWQIAFSDNPFNILSDQK